MNKIYADTGTTTSNCFNGHGLITLLVREPEDDAGAKQDNRRGLEEIMLHSVNVKERAKGCCTLLSES
jgi:hypothetical protein